MSDENKTDAKTDDNGWVTLDEPDLSQNHFAAVVPIEGIAQAVKEYLVRQANLHPCHYRGIVVFCHLKDGGMEAIADITWWPEGTPEPSPLSDSPKVNDA